MYTINNAKDDSNAPIPTIKGSSLHDHVVNRLREMILTGELYAGERVAEKRLCDHFGISRTPLQEALKVLAAERLIILRPNRGAIVTGVDARVVNELFPLCACLERLGAEAACQSGLSSNDSHLVASMIILRAAAEINDSTRYRHAMLAFRERLFEVAGNSLLNTLYRALSRQALRACVIIGPLPPERLAAGAKAHETMLAYLAANDHAMFIAALHAHRMEMRDYVVDRLQEQPVK